MFYLKEDRQRVSRIPDLEIKISELQHKINKLTDILASVGLLDPYFFINEQIFIPSIDLKENYPKYIRASLTRLFEHLGLKEVLKPTIAEKTVIEKIKEK